MSRFRLPITPQFAVAIMLSALVGVLCGAAIGDEQPAVPGAPAVEAPRVATSIVVTASIVADTGVWSLGGSSYGWGGHDPSGRALAGADDPQQFRLVAEGVTVELVPLGAAAASAPPASVAEPAEPGAQSGEGPAAPPRTAPDDMTGRGLVEPFDAPTAPEALGPGAREAVRQYGLAVGRAGANGDVTTEVTRLFVPPGGSWTPLVLPAPVTTQVPVGESGSVDMNWPDDAPRFFLEQQGPDTYRKVELAEKEGYSVSAAPKPSGANYLVNLGMTKRALVGGKYDEQIGAYVGQPTVVQTVCTTGVPVVPGNMTVVTWRVPGGDVGGLGGFYTQWGLSSYGASAAPLHQVVGRPGGVSGTALRVTLQLAGDQPAPSIDIGQALPSTSEATPPLRPAVTGGGTSAPAQVAIQTKVYELRIGGDGWREMIGAGDPVTVIAKLADEGKAQCVSEPVIVSQDGVPATITITVKGSGDESEPGATDVESSADLGQSLTFTPRIGPNGELTLTVECSLDRLAALLPSPEGGRSCLLVMKLLLNAVAQTKIGEPFMLRGLTSLKQGFDAQGNAVPGDAVETIIVVTPRIVTDSGVNTITLTGDRRVQQGRN